MKFYYIIDIIYEKNPYNTHSKKNDNKNKGEKEWVVRGNKPEIFEEYSIFNEVITKSLDINKNADLDHLMILLNH